MTRSAPILAALALWTIAACSDAPSEGNGGPQDASTEDAPFDDGDLASLDGDGGPDAIDSEYPEDVMDDGGLDAAEVEESEEPVEDAVSDAAGDQATDVIEDPADADLTEIYEDTSDGEDDTDVSEVPLPGFGTISGSCGVVNSDEILLGDPHLFSNHLDFDADPYDDPADFELLSEGGQEIATSPNAGGSSICSEVFAYEMLYRCELAELTHLEIEIEYDTEETAITDMRVEIDGYFLGVSVTRAVLAPGAPYTYQAAVSLLRKKLTDIQESTDHVLEEFEWTKQILYVLAYSDQHAGFIQQAYEYFAVSEPDVLGDTLVMVTTTDGQDGFIYYSCPLD